MRNMELDIEKKSKFESRLKELVTEGDSIAEKIPGLEFGEFSQENIQIHRWCARCSLLIEGVLDTKSLLVEDVRNALKKSKKPHELFETILGVAKAVEDGCKAGDFDNRFMRLSKEENKRLDSLIAPFVDR